MIKISASLAALKILEQWGVRRIYGYPAGSVNSLMNALDHERSRLRFIQVRHEQVGALAAAAHAKLTGQLGVAFGSAGPGAVNMLDGLYDAREDHVPVLAIVGQADGYNLNYDYFQAMPEVPVFQDVSVYDRIIMNPESLPHVIDRAVRAAYYYRGVSVVVIPNNLGFIKIAAVHASINRKTSGQVEVEVAPTIVRRFLSMVYRARRPVFHVGSGISSAGRLLWRLSRKLQIPIVIDGPAKGLIPGHVANLGTSNHDVSKAADEIFAFADLVIEIGANYSDSPKNSARHHFKVIQVSADWNALGRYHQLSLAIRAAPKTFLIQALRMSSPMRHRFFGAAIADDRNWRRYLRQQLLSTQNPILPAAVYRQLNQVADHDAIFSVDIGDNLINSFRFLDLTPDNQLIYSVHFATMGCSLPGAIAAQLDYPDRQVFSIAGDGAFSMVMQDLVTMRKYNLPVINLVTSNGTTNYIREKQADLAMNDFGNRLCKQNFALIAKGMGVPAVNVYRTSQLPAVFDRARRVTKSGVPFLINVDVTSRRGVPVEDLCFDRVHFREGIRVGSRIDWHLRPFFNHYHGQRLRPLTDFLTGK